MGRGRGSGGVSPGCRDLDRFAARHSCRRGGFAGESSPAVRLRTRPWRTGAAPERQRIAAVVQMRHAFAVSAAEQRSWLGTEIGTEAFGTEKDPGASRVNRDISFGVYCT